MKTITIEVPTMYGDHHVIEVRKILLELSGVEDIYASSGFHIVEVTFDEGKIDEGEIAAVLEEAGYLGELEVPVELGTSAERENGQKPYFRHTAAYEQTNQVVSFTQAVPYTGRPLWPCPGFGALDRTEPD
jgi:copper chaperone CopZ